MHVKKENILMKKSATKPVAIACLLVLALILVSLARNSSRRPTPKNKRPVARQSIAPSTRSNPPVNTVHRRALKQHAAASPSQKHLPAPSKKFRRKPHSEVSINPATQLMITDLRVVEDPVRTNPSTGRRATWTFKYLMENMAGENDPAEFTLQWLKHWEEDQVVNEQISPARALIREKIIEPWLEASGGERLNLRLAPFKLLAIVNRMDLRIHNKDSVTTGGEGRFVFGVLNQDGTPLPPIAGPAPGGFTVIFEYELIAYNMRDLEKWAHTWHGLGRHRIGSRGYNRALERITRGFTDAGKAPGKVNGNSINQIRSNEFAIGPNWELREFVLDADTGLLTQNTVALTPDTILANGTQGLKDLINENEASILDGTFTLPAELFGSGSVAGPFLPSDFPDFEDHTFTIIPFFDPFVDIPWSAEGISNNEARHKFALNTCNGCHRSETDTDFLQVGFPLEHMLPASLGNEAQLAAFLTGGEAIDPVVPETVRTFNDLERRSADLKELLDYLNREGSSRPPRKAHRPRFVH